MSAVQGKLELLIEQLGQRVAERNQLHARTEPTTSLKALRIEDAVDIRVAIKQAATIPTQTLDTGEISTRLIATVQNDLPPTAYRIYSALHQVALAVARARGYHPSVSRVTFHCPEEILAAALGINRTTIWRNLPALLERGLVAARAHKGTLRGETKATGKLWQVKLHPSRGKSARLSHEEFKHPWRDLDADVKHGRTAFKTLQERTQQSKELRKNSVDIELLLDWALPPASNSHSLILTVAPGQRTDLETILDVPHAERTARNEMVDTAARAINHALHDDSVDFYRKLIWNLLRRKDQGQDDFYTVYTMIRRARSDYQEGFARSAGALLVSRLKKWAVWDELERTPPVRVGTPPKQL
jgi:hypothetical protein